MTPTPDAPFPDLTDREHEILELIAQGLTNNAIAEQLVISPKTVRNNVSTIFSKLQVASRSEAIIKARNAGLGNGQGFRLLNFYGITIWITDSPADSFICLMTITISVTAICLSFANNLFDIIDSETHLYTILLRIDLGNLIGAKQKASACQFAHDRTANWGLPLTERQRPRCKKRPSRPYQLQQW